MERGDGDDGRNSGAPGSSPYSAPADGPDRPRTRPDIARVDDRRDGDRPTSSTNWQGKTPPPTQSAAQRADRPDGDRPTSSTNWQGKTAPPTQSAAQRTDRPDGDRPTSSTNWQGKSPAGEGASASAPRADDADPTDRRPAHAAAPRRDPEHAPERPDGDRPTSSGNWQGKVLGLRVEQSASKTSDPGAGQLALCVAGAHALMELEPSRGGVLRYAAATATLYAAPDAGRALARAEVLAADLHPAQAFSQGHRLPSIRPLVERGDGHTVPLGDDDWSPVDQGKLICFHDGTHGVAFEQTLDGTVTAIRLLSRDTAALFGADKPRALRLARAPIDATWRVSPPAPVPASGGAR